MKIPVSDVNIPMSRIKYDVLLDPKEVLFELFPRPHVVMGKYLKIFHPGGGECIVLLRTNWEMLLTYSLKNNLWSICEIVDG